MEKFVIGGGKALSGEVSISGAKNAAVAIIPSTILADSPCTLENVPNIKDVEVMFEIMTKMGAKIEQTGKNTYYVDATGIETTDVIFEEAGRMRASYYILGALLAKKGKACVRMPGGCFFGDRPMDQHIKGFSILGAECSFDDLKNCVSVFAKNGLKGGNIYMDVVSVGATINVMIAAVTAEGTTVIENAAREPHIVDVANFLNMMGANIKGAGTEVIKIKGVKELRGVNYSIIPDQIEAGTYIAAIAATHGKAVVKNVIPKHLDSIMVKINEMGVKTSVGENGDSISIDASGELKSCKVKTTPHPGFPTDMQPQFVVLMSMAKGTSYMRETVWECRFQYIEQLKRTGMDVKISGNKRDLLIIEGGKTLHGIDMQATDLRAGAAMIIAALCANGVSTISNINYIERGYDRIVEKLQALGADIAKESC